MTEPSAPQPDLRAFAEPFCGMTWGWVGTRGTWNTDAARHSLDALESLGANWIVLAYATLQDTPQSTRVNADAAPTLTDDEVRWGIREAKRRGWKVCLKPVVNVANGTWRGFISFFDRDVPGEPTWAEWFASYGDFIVRHARIAEDEGVDLFCVGCEMVMTDHREAEWRALIARVREVYSGPITYNCDKYQEDRVTWWDAVDVISASGYYPTGEWPAQLDRVEAVVLAHGKPFVFIEAGCPSRDTSPARPNDWTLAGEPSGDAQARYLDEMLRACADRAWVTGVALWDWPAELYAPTDAALNTDYCMYAKPGETVVRAAYRAALAGGAPPISAS